MPPVTIHTILFFMAFLELLCQVPKGFCFPPQTDRYFIVRPRHPFPFSIWPPLWPSLPPLFTASPSVEERALMLGPLFRIAQPVTRLSYVFCTSAPGDLPRDIFQFAFPPLSRHFLGHVLFFIALTPSLPPPLVVGSYQIGDCGGLIFPITLVYPIFCGTRS